MFKMDDHQSYLQQHQRKDSASSEVAALLCISGRTSRISSVGSQGSAVSRLSAVSGVSRSPSPHRMLLETSFCGPKPVESIVDGSVGTVVEAPTAALLEQVLLARTRDPTQAILAEGIKLENSPKKKPPTSLTNGDAKMTAKIKAQNRPEAPSQGQKSTTMGTQRKSTKSPGQMIVGKTPSGTEYIRINLKPDFMYDDKGIASHEKVVEAPNSLQPVYASKTQTKPASLSLQQKAKGENLLTPQASPKPQRKGEGSRSPSPATVSVSRKSSFSSLFRFGGGGKDSPDSPRERSRPRSKSKERGQTPQSQNATPNKQKSVLAIFKPGKRGSSAGAEGLKTSKTSSPTDAHEMQQLQMRSKSHTPAITATGSRPNSRLKYYDEPVEGYIHIPLHTPPEEKETRKLLQSIQQLNAEPVRPQATAITMSDLESAVKKLKPVAARKNSGEAPVPPPAPPKPPQPFPLKRIENLDAIHSLPQEETKERTWSLEVNRHSSQDSQDTVASGESWKMQAHRNLLAELKEHVAHENGIEAEAEIHRLPSQESTTSAAEVRVVETKATINTPAITDDSAARERRRLMFATRVGSGSQEQIFATQFSISKTESISSHMSEHTQDTLSESITENLKRQNTVIKKPSEETDTSLGLERKESFKKQPLAIAQIEEQREIFHKSETKESLRREETKDKELHKSETKESLKREETLERQITVRKKSVSTSEDEKFKPPTTATPQSQQNVVMRRKTSGTTAAVAAEDKHRNQSRSTSEDDNEVTAANHRHSRYLENFDVRKKYHENVTGTTRKPRKSSGGGGGGAAVASGGVMEINPPENFNTNQEQYQQQRKGKPQLPQPPPPSTEPSPLHTPSPSVKDEFSSQTATTFSKEPRSHSQSPVDKARQTPPKPPRTSPTLKRAQNESPSLSKPSTSVVSTSTSTHKKHHTHVDRSSVFSTDEPVESSESERDSDIAALESKRRHLALNVGCIEDHESTGLVSQESFDDELPYIPTTLPEEKAQGVSLIPMKERVNMEVKTCPLDRPRSTTPLNPSHLEEYIGGLGANTPDSPFEMAGSAPVRGEKLRISLPRKDSKKDIQSSKSPRRVSNASGKSWFEFAEEGLRATAAHLERKDSNKQLLQQQQQQQLQMQQQQKPLKKPGDFPETKTKTSVANSKPPVTTPKTSTQRKLSGHWIDFENIPEKRKPPKKITTLPRDSVTSATMSHQQHTRTSQGKTLPAGNCTRSHKQLTQQPPDVTNVDSCMPHYNYVKPEDCQCECHESKIKEATALTTETSTTTMAANNSTPSTTNSNQNKAQGVDLLPKGEDMLPLLSQDSHEGIEPR